MSTIHPTAIVSDGAEIGEGTSVGPYSIIGPKVKIGKNNTICPHVVIEGNTIIGDSNHIFQFASVGSVPQDLKFHGELSTLTIGSENLIREYVTIQPGTEGGGMKTSVGDKNLFMACSHVAHDCIVGNENIFANSMALAGHVIVGNQVTIGGMCGVHQFAKLGDLCLLGAASMVTKDVPPFCVVQGDRAGMVGLNKIGLERRGHSKEDVAQVVRLYRKLFLGEGTFANRLSEVREEFSGHALSEKMLDFIDSSERGITLPRKKNS